MSAIRVGNAPCSWGVLELDGVTGDPIGYRQMLDELVATGYTGTELGDWGFMPTDPQVLRSELERRRLTMVGAFVPVRLKDASAHADGEARCLRTARLLAAVSEARNGDQGPFLVLSDDNGSDPVRAGHAGRVTPELGLSPAEWDVFAGAAERLARSVRAETGLRTVFHHHCAGYVETPDEIANFLELTDPATIGLVFDTGHYAYGSGTTERDAVPRGLRRFADRIWYVQFKDCHAGVADRARVEGWDYLEAVRHGLFCELGQGSVDFPAAVAWLRERDYRGWVLVEQDILPGMGAPRESAQRDREYLRAIGL
jgi:inosose dehydratase